MKKLNNQILLLVFITISFLSCNKESSTEYKKSALLVDLGILNRKTQTGPATTIGQGLIAYYPFTGNALDASGNGNHVTSVNGATLTTDRKGKKKGAYYFNGNAWLSGSASNYPNGNAPRSMSFWYNAENFNQAIRKGLFGYGGGGCGTSFIIQVDNHPYPVGNYEIQGHCTAFFNYTPYMLPANNAWHHIAITYDGNIIRFYNDGSLVYTSAMGILTNTNSSGRIFAIGREVSSDGLSVTVGAGYVGIQGKMDELRIHNRALTIDEIKYLFLN